MVTVKQVRAKRAEVLALAAALEAAQLAHSECVAELTHAADKLKVTKNAWVEGRDQLEELGREFALDEGENDFTPPMTFDPPQVPVMKIEGNLSIGPAGTPVPAGPPYDAKKTYVVKRDQETGDTWCACNESISSGTADGQPCTYHKLRSEFREPMSGSILFWPLQEVQSVPVGISDDEIPF